LVKGRKALDLRKGLGFPLLLIKLKGPKILLTGIGPRKGV